MKLTGAHYITIVYIVPAIDSLVADCRDHFTCQVHTQKCLFQPFMHTHATHACLLYSC